MAKNTMTSRQAQAQETSNRIYAAAIELMDRKGFDRITIADISKKAGVSVGAFYHYFESKDDILAEIFRRADEYFTTEVAPQLPKKGVRQQILAFFDHYARFNILSGVEMTRELFSPKIKFFVQKGRPMQDLLVDVLRHGKERGELSGDAQPEEIAAFLFVMARGIVFDWSLRDGQYDLRAAMRAYMRDLVSIFAR
jgi:AcrR family transcriptional regulator